MKNRGRFSGLIAILAACALLVACDDGPTAPSPQAVPTPVPIPNLAGNWSGRVHVEGVAAICASDFPAAATFSQDGTRITGTVTMTQLGAVTTSEFLGDLQGSQLTGTLTAAGNPVSAGGTASSTHITLTYGRETLFCHKPVMDLVR